VAYNVLMCRKTLSVMLLLLPSFLGHIAVLCTCMRPIVTDWVAWSIGLSQSWAVQRRLNRSRYRLGCGLGWTQGSMY